MTARRSSDSPVIALDATGADVTPAVVLAGAALALKHDPGIRFLLFGDETALAATLVPHRALEPVVEIRHAAETIAADRVSATERRQGWPSSLPLAIEAVANGEADGVVSNGHAASLAAAAERRLEILPGFDRPATASFFPTLRGESVLLDRGGVADGDPEHLVRFAVMGALFARAVLGLVTPTIGLLDGGSETKNRRRAVQEAHAMLSRLSLPGRYHGRVTGDDIPAGTVDVIVTDGATGEVALKTAEGMAALSAVWLSRAIRSSWRARIGHLLARGAFAKLDYRTDPRRYDGGAVLGLRGICVGSRGGADTRGFADAIGVAVDLVREGYNGRLTEALARLGPDAVPSDGPPAALRTAEAAPA